MLNFTIVLSGGRAYSNAYFGVGRGPIFLDDVQCTSSASQLLECPSRPILSHNCRHVYDAGVGCEGNFICMGSVLPTMFCLIQYSYVSNKKLQLIFEVVVLTMKHTMNLLYIFHYEPAMYFLNMTLIH